MDNITHYWSFWFFIYSLIILLSYWFLKKDSNYWSKLGVFQLEPKLFYGNIEERMKRTISFHEFHKDLYFKTKGQKYVGFYEGRIPRLMVSDPDLIKCVLVKDFNHFVDRNIDKYRMSNFTRKMVLFLHGSEWKNIRASITPTFSSGKIKAMMHLINECACQLTSFIDESISKNGGKISEEMDVKDILGHFTLDVIANCAFGVETNSLKNTDSVIIRELEKFSNFGMLARILLLADIILLFPLFISKHLPISFFNEDTVNVLSNLVNDTIKLRKKNNIKRNDFLQIMLDAAEDEKNGIAEENNSLNGSVIDDDIIIGQSILFFVAGYETSSTLLATACYELAKNIELQDKLRAEILEVSKKYNEEVTYESINEMPYLEMVMAETLRMYPPTARLDRISTKEYTFPNTKLTIPKDTRIMIPTIGLHYDSEYFPNPEKFDPERFSTQRKSERSPYVYLPFGAGPRNCIGLRFAQLSTKMCMVYLIKNFQVQVCSKTVVPFVYDKKSMLLKSENGIFLSFSKCTNS